MVRTGLGPSIALAVLTLAACGESSTKKLEAAATGPMFSPLIANALRAIADHCKLERLGEAERRDCTGRQGTVQIALVGNRFSELTIALPSKILPEAKGHLGPGLSPLLGAASTEQVLAKMSELETGQHVDVTIGNAKIAISAGGTSKIAPAYTLALRWF